VAGPSTAVLAKYASTFAQDDRFGVGLRRAVGLSPDSPPWRDRQIEVCGRRLGRAEDGALGGCGFGAGLVLFSFEL